MGQELACLVVDGDNMCLRGEVSYGYEQQLDIKMLLYNRIPGFLPLQIQYVDEKSIYSYSLEGVLSLEKLLQNQKADYMIVERIYQGLLSACKEARAYFLRENYFVLEPSFLFWNVRKKQLQICYFPVDERVFAEEVLQLTRYLLRKIEHKDRKCVSFLYELYDILVQEGFAVAELASHLNKYNKYESGLLAGKHKLKTVGDSQPLGKCQKEERMMLKNISRWKQLPEQVEISQEHFLIGRGSENQFILPVVQISNSHARIDRKQEQLYITDLASTNGVFLNGKRLVSNHPVLCREKDIISFGDISYQLWRCPPD